MVEGLITFKTLLQSEKPVYTVDGLGRIRAHNLKENPRCLFDIGGKEFSDGWGRSWNYADYAITWAFDEYPLMNYRYEQYRSDSQKLRCVINALKAGDDHSLKVIKAHLFGFYGTLWGEQYKPDSTVTRVNSAIVDTSGNLSVLVGMPGPDYIDYHPKDYGKTWALTEEELKGKDNVIL